MLSAEISPPHPGSAKQSEGKTILSLPNVLSAFAAAILLVLAMNIGLSQDVTLAKHSSGNSRFTVAALNETLSAVLDGKLANLQLGIPTTTSTPPSSSTSSTSSSLSSFLDNSSINDATNVLPDRILQFRERQNRVNYSAVWMSDLEIDVMLRHLANVDTYLEWGSGGSTLNFARFARKRAHSIEHDKTWCSSMQSAISADPDLSHVQYHCVPIERGTGGWGENSPFEEGTYTQFRQYVDKLDTLNETLFDFVLVDGRARIPAAVKALSYISDDSVVILHDAERVFSGKINYPDVWKFYIAVDSVGGDGRQGILVLRRKPDFRGLQGDHAAVQHILDESYGI